MNEAIGNEATKTTVPIVYPSQQRHGHRRVYFRIPKLNSPVPVCRLLNSTAFR